MFAPLFFVSVGALMDIRLLPIFIVPVVVLVVISFVAKFLTVFISARIQGLSTLTALELALGYLPLEVSYFGRCQRRNRYWRYKCFPPTNGRDDDDNYHIYYTIYDKVWMEAFKSVVSKTATLLSHYFDIQKRLSGFRIFKKTNRK